MLDKDIESMSTNHNNSLNREKSINSRRDDESNLINK